MMERIATKIMVLICILLLSGCSPANTDAGLSPDKYESAAAVTEGIRGIDLKLYGHMAFSGTGDGILYVNTTVSSMNPPDQTEPVLLCAQAGCTHSDETCKAYIGNADYFLSYHNVWYYTVSESNNRLTLHSYDYKNGKRSVLHTWEGSEQDSIAVDNMLADHNRLYVSLYTASYSPEENTYYGKSKTDCIDLDQNTCVTVLESDEKEKVFEYCHNGKVLYTYTYLNGELPDYVEWIEQGKSEEEYSELLDRIFTSELRILDTETSTDSLLGSGIATTGIKQFEKEKFAWHDGKTVYVYDIEKQNVVSLDVEGIAGVRIFDGNVIYTTRAEDGTFKVYAAGTDLLQEGKRIGSEDSSDRVSFSIKYETENGFFGIYNDAFYWIRKADFYSGRFESSIELGNI